jgi:hypothetical protein
VEFTERLRCDGFRRIVRMRIGRLDRLEHTKIRAAIRLEFLQQSGAPAASPKRGTPSTRNRSQHPSSDLLDSGEGTTQ